MKKLLWTLVSAVLLTVIFAISAVGVSAAGGVTGDCTWSLDDNGHLTISGKGEMSNYGIDYNIAPWGTDITGVTIGKEVTAIGENAFYGCTELTNFQVEAGNTAYASKDGVLLSADKTTLLRYPTKKSGSYTVPDGVTTIQEGAFQNCTALTAVTIPNSVTAIGKQAFSGCTTLETAVLPDGLTSIQEKLFYQCYKLTAITIPDSVTAIEANAFQQCESLTTVSIPKKVETIGNYAFYNCSAMTSITIGEGVTSIGDYAFYYCDIQELNIPDSVTYIGNSFVASYDTLYKLVLGNGVTEIPDSPAIELVLGDGITEIPNYKFKNNTNLTSITLGKNVTTIGDFAFYNCSNLVYVDIGEKITHIGEEAFVNSGLYKGSQCWYNEVMYVGRYAVDADPNLSGECRLKEDTLLIAQGAFYEATQMTALTIPDGVKAIGQYAFYRCGITELVIPDSVTFIEPEAFEACTSLTKVTLSGNVTSIGNQAFKDCALTDVYYTGTKEEWKALTVGTQNEPLSEAEWHADFKIPTTTATESKNTALSKPNTLIRKLKSVAKSFLKAFKKTYTYVIAAAVIIVAIVIAVILLLKKKKSTQK